MRQLAYQRAQLCVGGSAAAKVKRYPGRRGPVCLELDLVLRDEGVTGIMRAGTGREPRSKLARNRAPVPRASVIGGGLKHLVEHSREARQNALRAISQESVISGKQAREESPSGEAVLQSKCCRRDAAAASDLLVDVGDVAIDGAHRDNELGGNLRSRPATGQPPQHSDYGRGQASGELAARRDLG